jgi:hypothetical protein
MLEQTPERECDKQECAICLSPLNRIDNELSETKCRHLFHMSCLHEMKSRNMLNCPVCRQRLTPPHYSKLPPPTASLSEEPVRGVNYEHLTSTTQHQIVQAAQRGRNAVRSAINTSYNYRDIIWCSVDWLLNDKERSKSCRAASLPPMSFRLCCHSEKIIRIRTPAASQSSQSFDATRSALLVVKYCY